MKSLFNHDDVEEIIRRIEKLSPEKQPLWGKMNVGQMTAHVQMPLKIAIGEIRMKRDIIGIMFGTFARKKYAGAAMFTHNLPTARNFVIRDQRDISIEKENLARIIHRFMELGPAGLSHGPHPIFGMMNPQEWDTIMWKHLDHHLRQFGV